MTSITRRRPCVAWHAITSCDPCLLGTQVCASPPREAYTRVYVYWCMITQPDVKPEASSNPQSWRGITRRTLASLSVRRLKFRRDIPLWHQHPLHALNIYPDVARRAAPAIFLADAAGVPVTATALPAATDSERPSASSGSISPSAPGTAVLTLSAPMGESIRTTMAAPETSIAAPTAESTSTMSSPLETRRLAPLEEPPSPEPDVVRKAMPKAKPKAKSNAKYVKDHTRNKTLKLPSRPAGGRRFKHVRLNSSIRRAARVISS